VTHVANGCQLFIKMDRVDSKANPVDGLSRGTSDGPWRQVDRARLPADLEERLKASVKEDANSLSEQPEFLSDNDI